MKIIFALALTLSANLASAASVQECGLIGKFFGYSITNMSGESFMLGTWDKSLIRKLDEKAGGAACVIGERAEGSSTILVFAVL